MRAWYIPAWNGDWRLEPAPGSDDTKFTKLTIEKPTALEKRVLAKLAVTFIEKKWIRAVDAVRMRDPSGWRTTKVTIGAPITEVGPHAASIIKPGQNVITAVRFKDGKIEVSETSTVSEGEAAAHPYRDAEPNKDEEKPKEPALPPKPKEADTPTEESKALAKKKDAEAAATVKRPTPCCPDCFIDPDETNKPATEVLLAFLNEEEHASWAKHRFIVVNGGITGHRYRIAHRHSAIAVEQTRLCWDLDDDALMHFHDNSVPPSEEVLATMLILKFREPWLRNEATTFDGVGGTAGPWRDRQRFKNPFGDGGDGVMDSSWTAQLGHDLQRLLGAN